MSPQPVRRALLVGINQYPDPRHNLKGCVNDVLLMGKTITEHFGFNPEDIRLLTDKRATTANMRERLHWLVDGAGPGSVLLFHFSGHGSQVRDRDGDELEDGLDEILCPYDLDWDDPFTDDELRKAIGSVPEGVNFTLVLDCCHSGTGTRQFYKEPGSRGRDQTRFLVPPPDVAFRMAAGVDIDPGTPERTVNMVGFRDVQRRKFGSALTDQNAILISGCRSDQTSADAWIDSDYHGALTYSLVEAVRTKRFSLSYADLIETAGNWLEVNSYEQVPQLENGPGMHAWSFLNTRPYEGSAAGFDWRPPSESIGAPNDARVIFVHGIGNHVAGYSDRWRAAFNRYLNLPLDNFIEVVWDDVFDTRSRGLRGLEPLPDLEADERVRAEELTEEIRALMESRLELAADLAEPGTARLLGGGSRDRAAERGLMNWLLNFDEYIGDFVKYLASDRIRTAVDNRLSERLNPLLQSGAPVILVTHSWGTVVAHHTIRALDGPAIPQLHCTLGSPLWMLPVRKMLRFDNRTRGCDYWINVDAKGDLVGGSLVGKFAVNEDHSVPAVGSGDPHGSYFHPDNAAVQRDIVAAAMSKIARALL
ncbi:MAG: caspase domain-containing protein [Dehalococcoidia bacterium]